MGSIYFPPRRYPNSPLDLHEGQFGGRLPDPEPHGALGVQAEPGDVLAGSSALLGLPNTGCFCVPLDCPAPSVHVVVPRQHGCGQGCSAVQLGSSDLSFPASTTDEQSALESQIPGNSSNSDLPALALS